MKSRNISNNDKVGFRQPYCCKKEAAIRILMVISMIAAAFAGCQEREGTNERSIKPSDISYWNNTAPFDQSPSMKAKQIASGYDGVLDVESINTDQDLLVVFKLEHMKRFQLKQMEKKLKKRLEKTFSKHRLTVSSDMKIYLETEKIAKDLNVLNKKEMKQKIEKIVKLSKEQT